MRTTLLLTLIILFLSIDAFPQKKKWEEARQTHSIEAYQAFIKKYPKSDFKSEAENQIKILKKEALDGRWKSAQEQNDIDAYKDFLKSDGRSEYADEAKKKLADLEWKKAEAANTRYALKEFVKKYGSSSHAATANEKLKNYDYLTQYFRPSGRTNTQGNETGYVKMTVFKSWYVDSGKREIMEKHFGESTSESTEGEMQRCVYEGLSFWTNKEIDYWNDQGDLNKTYTDNEPRTLILYYDMEGLLKKIEVAE